MRKSWILGSPNPPKISQKSVLNRPCQKVVIFDKKYGKNCNFSKRGPLILSPWPVFRKLFYEIAFEAPTKFGLQKIIKKPLKNHPQTSIKSMKKSCYFWTSYFSRFYTNLDRFGVPKWAQKR